MKNVEEESILKSDNSDCSRTSETSEKSPLPWGKLLFCLFLYIAQGLIVGNNMAVPVLLIDRDRSLKDLAILYQAFLPYSLKIFLAPIVDTYHIKSIGYRKTWICLFFTAGGLLFLGSSFFIENLLEGCIWKLTVLLFTLTTFQAIADIAVDAWSLVLFSDYDSSLKSVSEGSGVKIGQLISKTVFILLESPNFSNAYIRPFFKLPSVPGKGIITISSFYGFLGGFLISMALIAFLKTEKKKYSKNQQFRGNLKQAYQSLWKIVKVKNVRILGAWFSTSVIFIICGYGLVMVRIQQNGVSRDVLAILDVPIVLVKIVAPLVVVKLMLRDKILDIYRVTYFFQIICSFLGAGIVFLSAQDTIWTENEENSVKSYPIWFYVIILLFQSVNMGFLAAWGACSTGGFVNRVVDQRISGSYITTVMCFTNIGWRIIMTVITPLIDWLSVYDCRPADDRMGLNLNISHWNSADLRGLCKSEEVGGEWITVKDGFYSLSLCLGGLGFIYWWLLSFRLMKYLEKATISSWKVKNLYDEETNSFE